MRAVVRRIPPGKVATYGQVAALAGHPRGSRQVAWALRQFDAGLPWHRVVGKDGARYGKVLLRGAAGVDQVLRLETEGVRLEGTRIRLEHYGWQGPFSVTPERSEPRCRAHRSGGSGGPGT
ncbi:MAG: MGMT family protein [Acidobacteriaceae bacterium]|jgi:methylated-DNA-protein-cysteine methyltransferase-like protein|nr:MGMT family protein [Acidobacteriaceae bacterium]